MRAVIQNGEVQTLCRQCDMRCALTVRIAEGKVASIAGSKDHPQNRGLICAKGKAALDLVDHADRLLKPLKRGPNHEFVEIDYEKALDEIANSISGVKDKYGPRSIGVWSGEALGFFQQEQYARRFIHALGSPNFFSANSVCYSARYMGYRFVQGYWNTCPDYRNANLVLLWGSNLPVSHPPHMIYLTEGKKKGAKIIVVDPRSTRLAEKADVSAQPLPGTDGALALGLTQFLIQNQSYDREFVEDHAVGFDSFAEYVSRCTPEWVESQTGIDRNRVVAIGRMIAENRPRVVNYVGTGVEHHDNGFDTVRAVACLGGLCGAVDIRGGDPWPEAMGGRTLTLYEDLPLLDQEPIGAKKYPALYESMKECHSMTGIDRMLGRGGYPIKALIVTGANPVLTNPNAGKISEALGGLDLLIFRDLFQTESSKLAHYVLPAASFLERSELHYHAHHQMVTLSTKVLDNPLVQDEYTFWHDLAHRLGFGERYFPWEKEEDVNRWILEPTGITLDELQDHPEGIVYQLFQYKKYRNRPLQTPSGKFEFTSQRLRELGHSILPEYTPPRYRTNPDTGYPFVLITGARKALYYHSRFRNLARFRAAMPNPEVEIHPNDAAKLMIQDNQRVKVTSKIGSIEIAAKIVGGKKIRPGVVQITHGWDEANVNLLTDDRVNDPITGFPLLKAVPVKIEKVDEVRSCNSLE